LGLYSTQKRRKGTATEAILPQFLKKAMSQKLTTHSIVIIALFVALLCVSAYISIPLFPLTAGRITLQNFVVLLIAFILPFNQSVLTLLAWLLLGSAGIPVFIGGSAGISYIASGWGGYSIAFVLIAAMIPLLRGRKYKRTSYTILAIFAAVFIDIFGALWLMCLTGLSVRQAILTGFLPFIPLDTIKAVIAVQAVPRFRQIVTTKTPG